MTTIYACGSNFFGQLGIGSKERTNTYEHTLFGSSEEQTLDHSTVKDVQCGAQFSVLLQKNGDLSICGTLNGSVFPVLSRLEIPLPVRCTQVACGRKHILLLMERAIVLSWGTGYFGQLGHGDDSSWDSPRMIAALEPKRLGSRVEAVVCGGSHSGVVTDSGRVYMWGLNRTGQCGQGALYKGKTDSILEPRSVDFSQSNAGGGDMGVVRALVCGRSHSAALTSTGRVFSWGDAGFGRLGLNEVKKAQTIPAEVTEFRANPALALAAGDFHMLALTKEGEVYSWGYGADGQTGHCAMLNVRLPKRVPFFNGKCVQSVACGALWSMAITVDGSLYCCGYGDGGWLGMEPPPHLPQVEVDNLTPIQASLLPDEKSEVCCFDSRHSVLRPRLVDPLRQYAVRGVRAGAGHTIVFCEARDGTTTPALSTSRKTGAIPPRHDGAKEAAQELSSMQLTGTISERKGVVSREPVSSKYDAKQVPHHLQLPVSSYQLSSAGDASGSNSSLSSIQQAQQAQQAQQKLSPRTASGSAKSSGGPISVNSTLAVNRVPTTSSGVALPLSPSSATAQLFSWVRHKKVAELSSFLAAGGDANTVDSAGNTPLIVACQNGHLQVCKLLLANSANLNASNFKGNTALHYCFSYGYEEIGEYLIKCGADDEQPNSEGLTCYEGLTQSDLDML